MPRRIFDDPMLPQSPLQRGEFLRWLIPILLAAIVSYFTAVGSLQAQIAVVVEREDNHYRALIQQLAEIKAELMELRRALQ